MSSLRAPDQKFKYQHCCVDLSWDVPGQVPALQEFIDGSRSISRETFCRFVSADDRIAIERRLGYAVGAEKGLHCRGDYHVAYLKGWYHGKPALAMLHSAIEYMFTTEPIAI